MSVLSYPSKGNTRFQKLLYMREKVCINNNACRPANVTSFGRYGNISVVE
jgi:hypothetical protein